MTLDDMTQAKWDALSPQARKSMRDNSSLHPKLAGLEGQRVRVTPKRAFGLSTFRVGISTGWRPVHLAMRGNAKGSSDVVNPLENFEHVKVL